MNKRIVIIGGGVVGLATAWELIKRGHQVQYWSAMPNRAAPPVLPTADKVTATSPLADSGVPCRE